MNDVTKDAGNDVTKDAGNDVTKDAGNDVTKDAGNDVMKDAGAIYAAGTNAGKPRAHPTAPLVVKLGGAAGNDADAVLDDVVRLVRDGTRCVLVHGGSDAATRLGEALGHAPQFYTSVSGHRSRRTDARTLEIFLMATALLNRRLVAALHARGVNALGLSGVDGGVLRAKRKSEIRVLHEGRPRILRDEWTGTPAAADAGLLRALLDRGLTPVLAPVALSERAEPLNVDGDRAAARVAADLGAGALLFLTNVPGVLRDVDDPASLFDWIEGPALERVLERTGGSMKKKLLAAQEALAGGVERAVIASSAGAAPISAALAGGGTQILPVTRARTRAQPAAPAAPSTRDIEESPS